MNNPEKLYTRRKQTNIICVVNHYTQTNTNNVNKTWARLQTTGGKDEPNFVLYAEFVMDITTRNPERKTHISTTHKS